MSGLFITFEGNEGSGKSTQIQILAERLRSLGREVLALREPGGTPLGEEIRHLLKHSPAGTGMSSEAELLLMNASRAQLVREVIRPALARNTVVLCDRFYDSTLVYQGDARGLPMDAVQNVIGFAVGDTIPNLTLFLDVPLEVSEARRASRSGAGPSAPDRFEAAGQEFFRRVEAGYSRLAVMEPARIKVIDATQSLADVTAAIWRQIEPVL